MRSRKEPISKIAFTIRLEENVVDKMDRLIEKMDISVSRTRFIEHCVQKSVS